MKSNRAFVQNPGRAILVTVTSECRAKRIICKTWTGTFANSADSDQTPRRMIRVCTVYLNYRKLRAYLS